MHRPSFEPCCLLSHLLDVFISVKLCVPQLHYPFCGTQRIQVRDIDPFPKISNAQKYAQPFVLETDCIGILLNL